MLNGKEIILMTQEGQMHTIWLPEGTPSGRYSFEKEGISCFTIEAVDGQWCAVSSGDAIFKNCPEDEKKKAMLRNERIIVVSSEGKMYGLYAEDAIQGNTVFYNYAVAEDATSITIGRAEGNDICYSNPMISSQQAEFQKRDGKWYIYDKNSANGTYVNKKKIIEKELNIGDVVYILGFRIIIGAGFFSMNTDGRQICVNSRKLQQFNANALSSVTEKKTSDEGALFNRTPRTRKALALEPIAIDGPPMSMREEGMPLMLTMGRNAVMSAMSAMSGNFMTIISTMVFPFITNRYTEKQRKDYEEKRNRIYREYLDKKKQELSTEKIREEDILRWNYPELNTVLHFTEWRNRLWERQIIDDDFLEVRIGFGEKDILASVECDEKEYILEEDELEKERRLLMENKVVLSDVPIMTSLKDDFVIGVSGSYGKKIEFVRNLILQLAITHSYDEVKIALIGEPNVVDELDFVKYLLHAWDDKKEFRFVADEGNESIRISEYIKKELYLDDTKKRYDRLSLYLKNKPYYVIIAFDKKMFDSMEVLKQLLIEDESIGVSIVAAFDDLPKECSKIIELEEGVHHNVKYIKQLDQDVQRFKLDECDKLLAKKAIASLANTNLKVVAQSYDLPKMMTFLEMFGVGKIEHLNIENRWKTNNPVVSLATPIGVGADGSEFTLDLHQKFQGPHGLVAGTTGSGKSEFLMTYILSMAVNYHPDEVAFVLIDYKGGGLAGAFDDEEHGIHLPHLIATITNLDGGAIQRSLTSIQSELVRRQRVFNEVKKASGEGTMDIHTYQRLYRNGVVSEPMPHLFIIADEFAELKQQEPEFMDKLISAARIGRSLGVHLILATQKPSGVVNDQIRSNTKFRICLKVQDAADSQDMLKRPEAAEIKETGRFYLQVGYNEYFAMGQSAWSGADYRPTDKVVVQQDDSIQVIDSVGQNILELRKKTEVSQADGTQLVSVVKYITQIAKERNIKTRPLWKPALPKILSYDVMRDWKEKVETPDGIYATIGISDNPQDMEQKPVVVDLSHCGNLMIIGEGGSGKSVMLQTMLYDLSVRYKPEELMYYIIDCSSHILRVFRDAPQCGMWVSENDEADIERLFNLIQDIAKERKKQFVEADVSTYDQYVKKATMPLLLLVIDGMSGLVATSKGENYQFNMGDMIKQCAGLGIQFIISSSHANDLFTKTKQEIRSRIALELKDKYEYSTLLGVKCEFTPAHLKGRGICIIDGKPLEFQTGMVLVDNEEATDEQVANLVRDNTKHLITGYEGIRLPVLDETEEYSDFINQFETGRIPLGYYLPDIKPVALPLKQMDKLSIYFGNPIGCELVFGNLLQAAKKNNMKLSFIKKIEKSCAENLDFSSETSIIECEKEELSRFFMGMGEELADRLSVLTTYCKEHKLKASRRNVYMDSFEYMYANTTPELVIIENFSDLNDVVSSDDMPLVRRIFELSKRLNIFFVAGFYPGSRKLMAMSLGEDYRNDSITLWLGGRFNKQPFDLPAKIAAVKGMGAYNKGMVEYRENIYSIHIPCGATRTTDESIDDKNIFG